MCCSSSSSSGGGRRGPSDLPQPMTRQRPVMYSTQWAKTPKSWPKWKKMENNLDYMAKKYSYDIVS